jgi:hypothetical protein
VSLTVIADVGDKLKRRLDQLEKLESENRHDDLVVTTDDCSTNLPESRISQPIQLINNHDLTPSIDSLVFSGTPAEKISESSYCLPEPSSDLTFWDTTIFNNSTSFNECLIPYESVNRVDCGCKTLHLEITTTIGSKKYHYFPQDHDNQHHSQPCSNSNLDAIQFSRACIIRAILSNCTHLGITEAMICVDDVQNPSIFFRPPSLNMTGVDLTTTAAIVQKTQAIFHILEPDLRPIEEQITTRHHSMIDILPFPTFRKNLITRPWEVNMEELSDDLLNGLICWTGPGLGRKARGRATENGSEGTPWDCRSWEAREWFLKKYWKPLGGEEGELVRQTAWWRRMRGEEDDIGPSGDAGSC